HQHPADLDVGDQDLVRGRAQVRGARAARPARRLRAAPAAVGARVAVSGRVDEEGGYDFHVDDDIRRAEGLPARAVTDVHFLNRELATIFERAWLAVPDAAGPARGATGDDARPLVQQVASRGSRVPIAQLGRPLFLQRGWDDDALRCFPNTCTHAWFPLVIGASRGPTLVCGQHGRRFDCEGKFVSQQGFTGDIPDFPRPCDHLTSLPIQTWRRLTFV